jgi:uncharacterized protein (DUF302 family)
MTCVTRRRAFLGAALAAGLLVGAAGCGRSAEGEEVTSLAPPPAAAGHPPGTVTLPIGSDVPTEVKKLQDAITAGGGTVAATVDNTADADLLGVTIPPNTVVVGGPPAAGLPMLRSNQQAAAALPGRYLVTQDASGAVKARLQRTGLRRGRRGRRRPRGEHAVRAVRHAGRRHGRGHVGHAQVRAADRRLAHRGSCAWRTATRRCPSRSRGSPWRPPTARWSSPRRTWPPGSGASGPALRATQSVLLSAPEFTTPLVAAAPTFGLELPLRFVIWLNDKNVTQVGYVDVGVLAARHGLKATTPTS